MRRGTSLMLGSPRRVVVDDLPKMRRFLVSTSRAQRRRMIVVTLAAIGFFIFIQRVSLVPASASASSSSPSSPIIQAVRVDPRADLTVGPPALRSLVVNERLLREGKVRANLEATRHPILELVEDAEKQYNEMLSKSSKTCVTSFVVISSFSR